MKFLPHILLRNGRPFRSAIPKCYSPSAVHAAERTVAQCLHVIHMFVAGFLEPSQRVPWARQRCTTTF